MTVHILLPLPPPDLCHTRQAVNSKLQLGPIHFQINLAKICKHVRNSVFP